MTDVPSTARLALPLLAMAQAQKEVTHNEALTLLDLLVQPVVEAGPLAAPPPSPGAGQGWIVGAGATGDWSGREGALALWTAGGWRFVAPSAGMRTLRLSDESWLRFDRDGCESGGRRHDRLRSARRDRRADSRSCRPWPSDLRLILSIIAREVRLLGNRLAICSLARNQRRR